jgi:hypothetical protein
MGINPAIEVNLDKIVFTDTTDDIGQPQRLVNAGVWSAPRAALPPRDITTVPYARRLRRLVLDALIHPGNAGLEGYLAYAAVARFLVDAVGEGSACLVVRLDDVAHAHLLKSETRPR